jgi:Ca-activated chloride channel family protein
MKFIRYSKFDGFDVFGVDLGELMDALSDQFLSSGYSPDYWWTRERELPDDTIDGLRQAILEALIQQGSLSEIDAQKMLDANDGKFRGSLLEELINKLIERLVEEGYLKLEVRRPDASSPKGRAGDGPPGEVRFEVTEKGLDFLGYKTLQKLLGSFGTGTIGRHETHSLDTGVEATLTSKRYEYGDTINLDVTRTLLSAVGRDGLAFPLSLDYGDLHVRQQDHSSSCATVVMLDCSHSMILYGEDRFTPAKKVAIALAHLIRTQYPGDSLRIVLFHDAAEELPLAKLASTQVGPYHTNTAEGLKLARRILASQRMDMRQIIMITDGKPTAAFLPSVKATDLGFVSRVAEVTPGEARPLYKNSMGNDPFVMAETFREVQACRKASIMINTFMLADDPLLVDFVKRMTAMTSGRAYFANPNDLTQFVLMDFLKRRVSRVW